MTTPEFQNPEAANEVGMSAATTRPLRIVMADDDPDEHLLMSMAADAAGLSADFIFTADCGELLERLEKLTLLGALPDLVILDIQMPGLDGIGTLQLLHTHPVFWQVPVMVFTASTDREHRVRAYANGAHWYEVKPSGFGDMVRIAAQLPERAASLQYLIPEEDMVDADVDGAASLVADIMQFLAEESDGAL